MGKFNRIIDFFERLWNPKYLKKVRFVVINFNKNKLAKYNYSVHWFLTQMLDKGKLPLGVIYIGTYGKNETNIVAYYNEKKIKLKDIKKFLNINGIKIIISSF